MALRGGYAADNFAVTKVIQRLCPRRWGFLWGPKPPLGAHETAIATTFQPSLTILASMGIRPDDSKTALRALLRRHGLLAAYLDAVNRIDGPNHRRRAAEFRLEHRPRRDLPTCRVLHFRRGPPSRSG